MLPQLKTPPIIFRPCWLGFCSQDLKLLEALLELHVGFPFILNNMQQGRVLGSYTAVALLELSKLWRLGLSVVLLGSVASFKVGIGARFSHAIIKSGRWALIIELPVITC